jgi:hypothetical protein
MQVGVLSVAPAADEKSYRKAVDNVYEKLSTSPFGIQTSKKLEGINRYGHPYHFFALVDRRDGGRLVFVANAICWREKAGQVVHVFFAGTSTSFSHIGQAAELQLFERSAEAICLSVE